MGFTILPICKQCEYKPKSIAVGNGKMNHQTVCNGPVWNKVTNEIVEINLLEEVKEKVITQRFILSFMTIRD